MKKPVIIVSGLPRSGTSMVMKMLEAGGIDILTDGLRAADEDNPQGYYEYERVKSLNKEADWIYTKSGQAIKVISALLYHLPADLSYKVLFMQRDMGEILASQERMLSRLGTGQHANGPRQDVLAKKFQAHLQQVRDWIAAQAHMDCLYANYNELVQGSLAQVHAIATFLEVPLNVDKMTAVVNPAFYRSRRE
jgi:hypothetical protein